MTSATENEALVVKAEIREDRGKEKIKKARKEGIIPAVIYGGKFEPMSLYLNEHDLKQLIQKSHGERRLLDIQMSDGESAKAFFKDFQREPVTDRIIHVDLLRVEADEEVTIRIPVRHHGGMPAGVKLGGLLEQIVHEIRVTGKPGDIPPFVSCDLTDLNLAETIHISELPSFKNVEYIGSPSAPVFTIAAKGKAAKEALREQAPADAAEGEEGEEKAEE